jgi:hypothetical protein
MISVSAVNKQSLERYKYLTNRELYLAKQITI